MSLINNEHLKKEIYKIINDVVDVLNKKINDVLHVQYKLEERIKCLEAEKMKDKFITEEKIDEYRHEGYDRNKDDVAEGAPHKVEMLKCHYCGGEFSEYDLDMVNGEWYCQCCEDEIIKCGHEDMKDDIQEDN